MNRKWYITNRKGHPINPMWASGLSIRTFPDVWEMYSSKEEAEERLEFLRETTGRPLSHLKVSNSHSRR